MNLERLGTVLQHGGFTALKTNKEEICLYYRKWEDTAYILVVCHFLNENLPDIAYVRALLERISRKDEYDAEKKELLVLLCTDNPVYGKYLIQSGIPAWILNVSEERLMVYEDQPENFAGIRRSLEAFLDGNEVRGKAYPCLVSVNTMLVVVNVLIFFAMLLAGVNGDGREMIRWGAMFPPLVKEEHEYYRLFTAMFLHFDVEHLTGNMVILLALGDNLEQVLGKVRYLAVYLVSGLGAGICSFLYSELMGSIGVAAGASGAVFGVIGALFCMLLTGKDRMENITAPRLGLMIAYILYTGFTTPQIDNAAHIGGLLTGIVLMGLMQAGRRKGRKET